MRKENSPGWWQIAHLPEGVTSRRREKGSNGGGLRRRTRSGRWDGKRWLRRFRRWPDDQEEDDIQSPGWWSWRKEPGMKQYEPGRIRRSEEPGQRQEGLGAGGARRDPGHSHDGGPQWSRRRKEPWWRKGWRLQGADRWRRSRWWRSPRWRRRADEPGRHRGSGGPRQGRWRRRPRRRHGSGRTQWSRSDWGARWSWREGEAWQSWRDEVQSEEWSPEAADGRRQTKAEPERWGSPAERRELGAMVEPLGQKAEVEGKTRDPPGMTRWRLTDPPRIQHTDVGLRVRQRGWQVTAVGDGETGMTGMTGGGRRGRVGGKSRWVEGSGMVCATHTHHIKTPNTGNVLGQPWPNTSRLTESSYEGRRRGAWSAYISQSQSIEHCSPSAMVQWAVLLSALLLSIALSTMASSVASSRTWSDVMGEWWVWLTRCKQRAVYLISLSLCFLTCYLGFGFVVVFSDLL